MKKFLKAMIILIQIILFSCFFYNINSLENLYIYGYITAFFSCYLYLFINGRRESDCAFEFLITAMIASFISWGCIFINIYGLAKKEKL